MPLIEEYVWINAPIERCFDLCRSVDMHLATSTQHQEQVVAGRQSGLLTLGETITWKARHLGVTQTLTSQITALDYPYYFKDEMVKGTFKTICHEHYFAQHREQTWMYDRFYFESPLGALGHLANVFLVTRHMRGYLHQRNLIIQQVAEGDLWENYIAE